MIILGFSGVRGGVIVTFWIKLLSLTSYNYLDKVYYLQDVQNKTNNVVSGFSGQCSALCSKAEIFWSLN